MGGRFWALLLCIAVVALLASDPLKLNHARSAIFLVYDLFGKPASTFPDHALAATAASKQPNESCPLDETVKDGFIALRDGPGVQAKIIAKMDPKGAVIPRIDRAGWRKGNWILVSYWRPGIEFEEALKTGPVGWMNERLHTGCG